LGARPAGLRGAGVTSISTASLWRSSVSSSLVWITWPPVMVAGTAPCSGPVQKPAGSGGAAGSAAVPRSRTISSPRRFNARSAPILGDLEAVVEFQIFAVAHIDLHHALV